MQPSGANTRDPEWDQGPDHRPTRRIPISQHFNEGILAGAWQDLTVYGGSALGALIVLPVRHQKTPHYISLSCNHISLPTQEYITTRNMPNFNLGNFDTWRRGKLPPLPPFNLSSLPNDVSKNNSSTTVPFAPPSWQSRKAYMLYIVTAS